ncbi:uncharacterized protein RAG0_15473 [Rhynchosporium agropyri]|uniref:Uncharacterized protein n=1 Tax=Rhynchosporium agropyri TaxID=914238 RepID=A0A1E1LLE3_9HELO|nr:uncharacterized protein RAG0_15473 [Rhynchosporium agropyri]
MLRLAPSARRFANVRYKSQNALGSHVSFRSQITSQRLARSHDHRTHRRHLPVPLKSATQYDAPRGNEGNPELLGKGTGPLGEGPAAKDDLIRVPSVIFRPVSRYERSSSKSRIPLFRSGLRHFSSGPRQLEVLRKSSSHPVQDSQEGEGVSSRERDLDESSLSTMDVDDMIYMEEWISSRDIDDFQYGMSRAAPQDPELVSTDPVSKTVPPESEASADSIGLDRPFQDGKDVAEGGTPHRRTMDSGDTTKLSIPRLDKNVPRPAPIPSQLAEISRVSTASSPAPIYARRTTRKSSPIVKPSDTPRSGSEYQRRLSAQMARAARSSASFSPNYFSDARPRDDPKEFASGLTNPYPYYQSLGLTRNMVQSPKYGKRTLNLDSGRSSDFDLAELSPSSTSYFTSEVPIHVDTRADDGKTHLNDAQDNNVDPNDPSSSSSKINSPGSITVSTSDAALESSALIDKYVDKTGANGQDTHPDNADTDHPSSTRSKFDVVDANIVPTVDSVLESPPQVANSVAGFEPDLQYPRIESAISLSYTSSALSEQDSQHQKPSLDQNNKQGSPALPNVPYTPMPAPASVDYCAPKALDEDLAAKDNISTSTSISHPSAPDAAPTPISSARFRKSRGYKPEKEPQHSDPELESRLEEYTSFRNQPQRPRASKLFELPYEAPLFRRYRTKTSRLDYGILTRAETEVLKIAERDLGDGFGPRARISYFPVGKPDPAGEAPLFRRHLSKTSRLDLGILTRAETEALKIAERDLGDGSGPRARISYFPAGKPDPAEAFGFDVRRNAKEDPNAFPRMRFIESRSEVGEDERAVKRDAELQPQEKSFFGGDSKVESAELRDRARTEIQANYSPVKIEPDTHVQADWTPAPYSVACEVDKARQSSIGPTYDVLKSELPNEANKTRQGQIWKTVVVRQKSSKGKKKEEKKKKMEEKKRKMEERKAKSVVRNKRRALLRAARKAEKDDLQNEDVKANNRLEVEEEGSGYQLMRQQILERFEERLKRKEADGADGNTRETGERTSGLDQAELEKSLWMKKSALASEDVLLQPDQSIPGHRDAKASLIEGAPDNARNETAILMKQSETLQERKTSLNSAKNQNAVRDDPTSSRSEQIIGPSIETTVSSSSPQTVNFEKEFWAAENLDTKPVSRKPRTITKETFENIFEKSNKTGVRLSWKEVKVMQREELDKARMELRIREVSRKEAERIGVVGTPESLKKKVDDLKKVGLSIRKRDNEERRNIGKGRGRGGYGKSSDKLANRTFSRREEIGGGETVLDRGDLSQGGTNEKRELDTSSLDPVNQEPKPERADGNLKITRAVEGEDRGGMIEGGKVKISRYIKEEGRAHDRDGGRDLGDHSSDRTEGRNLSSQKDMDEWKGRASDARLSGKPFTQKDAEATPKVTGAKVVSEWEREDTRNAKIRHLNVLKRRAVSAGRAGQKVLRQAKMKLRGFDQEATAEVREKSRGRG